MVQRMLGARSIEDARKGTLLAASFKLLPIFILVIPGLFAAILFPEAKGDGAYSALLNGNIVPIGLKGLVIAGLLAAIMSSLSGAFNSIAILFTNDYYKLKYPNTSERKLVLVGRLATTLAVIAAILIVPLVKVISSQLYLFLQSAQSFIAPPITAVFIFGLFSRRMNTRTALITLAVTETIGVGRLLLELLKAGGTELSVGLMAIAEINFLHFSVALFAISVGMILTLSLGESRENNRFALQFRQSVSESISEIRGNFARLNRVGKLNSSFVLSAIILIAIIGVWSIWS